MSKFRNMIVCLMLSLILIVTSIGIAATNDFPQSPIHIVVPMSAGGSTDMVARAIQPFFAKYIGASVVVDNVVGGGGKLGVSQVYRARPDGYQLLIGVFPAWILTQRLDKNADYDVTKMVPLYNVTGNDYNAVAVPFDSPITNIKQFIEASNQKSLKVAGSGLGTNSYLSFVLLKDKVKAKVDYIPYNSGSDAALAVVGNHVDACVGSVISFKPLSDQNKIRIIATLGPQRTPLYPDVPTLKESGFKDATFNIILGFMAPPQLPKTIASKLEKAFEKAVNDPDFKAAAQKANMEIVPMNAAAYKKAIMESDKVVSDNLAALKAGSGN